jgi:hypothetical protein
MAKLKALSWRVRALMWTHSALRWDIVNASIIVLCTVTLFWALGLTQSLLCAPVLVANILTMRYSIHLSQMYLLLNCNRLCFGLVFVIALHACYMLGCRWTQHQSCLSEALEAGALYFLASQFYVLLGPLNLLSERRPMPQHFVTPIVF